MATKSRRGRPKGKTAGTKKSAAKSASSNGGEKLTVAEKRLEGVNAADRKKAVKMLAGEATIADVAKFLKMSAVKAKYLVMQQQVNEGDVPKISPTNEKAIVKALASDGDYSSVAWVACRTGLSDGQVKKIAEENGHSFDRGRPKTAGSKKTGKTKAKGKSTARRGSKARRGRAANPS